MDPSDLPLPPRDLALRVFAIGEAWSDADRAYLELGEQTKQQVVHLLPDDFSFAGKRVLDFGCGAGRTLRHFAVEAQTGEFWGCDIDEPSIAWMQQNMSPPFHAWKSAENPPLGLEHGSFDLIYAVSVFTHLTYNSTAWLLELHRMLKPGGLLIATFTGRWTSKWLASEPWVEDRIGMNVLAHDNDWDSGGPAVLISEWWLREHWGRAFDILTIDPQFHNFSWLVARRREVEVTTEDIERASEDPRETLALRHNIAQLQNEMVSRLERKESEIEYQKMLQDQALREQAAAYEKRLAEALASYENSLSWRATKPLRVVFRAARNSSQRRG